MNLHISARSFRMALGPTEALPSKKAIAKKIVIPEQRRWPGIYQQLKPSCVLILAMPIWGTMSLKRQIIPLHCVDLLELARSIDGWDPGIGPSGLSVWQQ